MKDRQEYVVWYSFEQYGSLANIDMVMIELGTSRKTTAEINVLDVITTNKCGRWKITYALDPTPTGY